MGGSSPTTDLRDFAVPTSAKSLTVTPVQSEPKAWLCLRQGTQTTFAFLHWLYGNAEGPSDRYMRCSKACTGPDLAAH